MEVDRATARRVFQGAILAVLALGLGVLASLLAGRASQASQPARKYLSYLAVTAVALLGVVVVALVWTAARLAASRNQPTGRRSQTPDLDAWSLSGKRFQLPPDEEE